VTVFSPNDISGLRRLKNVKCGIEVASSTRMMSKTLGKSFFLIVAKICKKKTTKNPTKNAKHEQIILHTLHLKPYKCSNKFLTDKTKNSMVGIY